MPIVNPGLRRVVGLIGRLFSGASMFAPLTKTLVLQRGTGSPTFTRATTKTGQKYDPAGNLLFTALSGEAVFSGARRVRNLQAGASEFVSGWTAAGTSPPTISYGTLNGYNAVSASFPVGAGTVPYVDSRMSWNSATSVTVTSGVTKYVMRALVQLSRPLTGAEEITVFLTGGGGSPPLLVLNASNCPTTPTEITSSLITWLVSMAPGTISVYVYASRAIVGTPVTVSISKLQWEDVTGHSASHQVAGEYVSVGVVQRNVALYSQSIAAGYTLSGTCAATDNYATYQGIPFTRITNATGGACFRTAPVSGGNGTKAFSFRIKQDGTTTGTYSIGWFDSTASATRGYVQATIAVGGTMTFAGVSGATVISSTLLGDGVYEVKAQVAGIIVANINVYYANFAIGTATSALVSAMQAENTDTNTDYQATGGSYAYHGSGVDGVKCFDTDIDGNALATSYTYDAVSLNGVAGTYVSTPDSAANSITGDIDIRVKAALVDWTPSAFTRLLSKVHNPGQFCYSFLVNTTGTLYAQFSLDGNSARAPESTVATGFADGTTNWCRVTFSVSTGVAKFYTSTDGVSWAQLGADVTVVTGAIFDGTDPVWLGGHLAGTQQLNGKIYRAQIYNGIGGTLAVDFDASRYNPVASATTLTGTTGETWTLQGNAKIWPTNGPMLGYSAEPAATNLCLQSNALTTTWINIGTPAATQNAVGPDGAANTAWTLTDNDNTGSEAIYQVITLTAATHTVSFFVKKESSVTGYPVILCQNAATLMAICTIDPINGIANVWTATTYGGFSITTSSASCVSYNSTYWRISLTFLATAANWNIIYYPAGSAAAAALNTQVTPSVVGSSVIYGAQLETGSVATSYIATTTIAVARNADVDSLPTASNIVAAAGAVAITYTPTHNVVSGRTVFLWGTYVDASNYTAILHDGTNLIFRKRIAASNYDATIANAYVAGAAYKCIGSWGAGGTTITLNGTEGTPHANTTAAQIGATMQPGADGNSLQQPVMNLKDNRVWQRQPSASERVAVTR